MTILLIYLALQIVNVILATIKSIVTVRGTKLMAAIMNALSYSVNIVVVIYSVMNFNIWIKIAITAFTNFVGTYLGIYLLEKTRKEKLWEISGTVIRADDYVAIKEELRKYPDIKYHSLTLDDNQGYIFYVYTKTKSQSRVVKDLMIEHKAYTVAKEENVRL